MTTTPSPRVASPHRSIFSIAVGLVGLAGVAAIWLPFAYSTSPARAVTDGDLWYLAVPFLLAIPITAAYAWWTASGRLPTGAQWGARVLAACSMAVTALFYASTVRKENWPDSGAKDWAAFLMPLAIAAGWALLAYRWRPGPQTATAPEAIALMEVAYLVNAVLCLLAFAGEFDLGGWISLVVSAAYAAHAIVVVKRSVPGSPTG